jgi:hypothetical protein
MDRLLELEQARCGPFYLAQPPIADMVVDAIFYTTRKFWGIMKSTRTS